jgi:hypothetical protein
MVSRRRRWASLLVPIALAAFSLAGCAGDDTPPKPERSPAQAGKVYVGQVDASKANIGLVTRDGKLAGMVCQDEKTSRRLDVVTLSSGAAELTQDGTMVGTVSVADDIAVGTVDIDGSKHKFRAEPATGGAGVYRLAAESPDEAWDGWIVLNDGSFTGTQKSKPSTAHPWIDPEIDP